MKELKIAAEVYSRVSGYFRPVAQWNNGKKAEFVDRKMLEFNNNKTSEFDVKVSNK